MLPPPLWGPPPPLCGTTPVGAVVMPGPGGLDGEGDGLGIGAALTGPTPNIGGAMTTPAAIAAALATRLRFIGFRFPRRLYVFNVLINGYPGNAETNPATPHIDVAVGLTTGSDSASRCCAARESSGRSARRCGFKGALWQISGHSAASPGASPTGTSVPPALFGWNARRRRARILVERRG
jgi:hypothetical protein